ncbi:MAG: hypothetical protein Q8O13_09970 [Candidatus Omnitrophota bacterium]|nr:hypothetical protein [Candidatus Omnitrophota bacterium]
MLEPENDNIEKEANQEQPEPSDSKEVHLHKPISSIFGQESALSPKAKDPKETANVSRYSRSGTGVKAVLIFKLMILVSIGIIVFLYYMNQKEASLRVKKEGDLVQVQAEAKSLQASLESLKESAKVNGEVKTKFEQLKESSAALNKKLQSISEEKINLENTLQAKDKKITELSNQLAALTEIKADLESRQSTPQEESSSQIESTEKTKPQGVVKKTGKVLVGKILVVKPASNIAVINLGSQDGIMVGSKFEILSVNNNYIAELIIDETEQTVSIGKVSPETASSKIKENYIVKQK